MVRLDGSTEPSLGTNTAPTTPVGSISGNFSCASLGESVCSSKSKLRAVVAMRLSSLQRSSRRGEPQAADRLPFRRLAGLGLEPAVELGAVLHQARQVALAAQLADQAGGVPGRAVRQRRSSPAPARRFWPSLRQVIGDGAAHRTAADDDDAGLRSAGSRAELAQIPVEEVRDVAFADPRVGAGHVGARADARLLVLADRPVLLCW